MTASMASQDEGEEKIPNENLPLCSEDAKKCFEGKNVLLSGASSGLGRALAVQLAHCGAKKIVISGRDEKSLQLVASECRNISKMKTQVVVSICDLVDSKAVKILGQKALSECPDGIDVLINNGGISSRSRFLDTSIEVDELLMKVNFLSGASLAKAVTPGMVQNGSGKIIWIGSVQGLVGIPHRTSYAASKFAVQGYCEALRAELTTSGISVHIASPGYIRTNLSRSAISGDGTLYNKMDETTAMGADPNDVAVDILNGVARGKTDLILAASFSAKAAIWLKLFAPTFLQRILVSRYEKTEKMKS